MKAGPSQLPKVVTSTLALTDEPVYLLGPVTAIAEIYADRLLTDSLLDFSSTTQGASGWSYGWRTDVDPTFHAGTLSQDNYDSFWTGPFYYLQIEAGSALGSAGRNAQGNWYQVWATRRYLPGKTVSARVVGSASRGSVGYGDGAKLNILLNGQPVFSQSLGTTAETCEANFDLTVTLTAGQPLDFCVTPGPGYDNSYDSCSFDVQIIALLEVPFLFLLYEPPTLPDPRRIDFRRRAFARSSDHGAPSVATECKRRPDREGLLREQRQRQRSFPALPRQRSTRHGTGNDLKRGLVAGHRSRSLPRAEEGIASAI